MLQLYAHPLSSYCWKAIIALRELKLDFDLLIVNGDKPDNDAAWVDRWPLGKMPLLIDGKRQIAETSVIVEYLDRTSPGAMRLIPPGRDDALTVRLLDRVFDNYVMTPMNVFVVQRIRPDGKPDQWAIDQARELLDRSYVWLEESLGEHWAHGDHFSLADCAGFPSLYYANYVHPRGDRFPRIDAYMARLLARPSVAQTLADAQPYWHFFPYANG